MAVKEIIKMGHPTLRLRAQELTKDEVLSEEFEQLVEDLYDTVEKYGGIGIAAPQIDVSKQVAIIGVPEDSPRYPEAQESNSFVVVNPKLTVLDEETQGCWEGCLSVPGLRGYVERPRRIRLEYLDENANEKMIEIDGFLATVFQHELDHLEGKLYVDHIKDMTKLSYEDEFAKHWSKTDSED